MELYKQHRSIFQAQDVPKKLLQIIHSVSETTNNETNSG
jgi:hypothetical protein